MENSLENKDCNIKVDIRKPKKVLNVSTSSQLSQARFTCRRQHTELIAKRINYQNACDSVGCLLFLVNDQAGFAIFDAMDRLKRSPLYKQKVKQLANKASKAYDLYEKTRRSMFLNKDVEELNYILQDKSQDWLQKHVVCSASQQTTGLPGYRCLNVKPFPMPSQPTVSSISQRRPSTCSSKRRESSTV